MAKGFDQRGQRVERQLNVVRIYQTATRPLLDQERLEEAQALLASLPVTHVPEPSGLPAGSRMTLAHNDFFVGRAPDLLRMAEALKRGRSVGVGDVSDHPKPASEHRVKWSVLSRWSEVGSRRRKEPPA